MVTQTTKTRGNVTHKNALRKPQNQLMSDHLSKQNHSIFS
jgi:hypothetical protein